MSKKIQVNYFDGTPQYKLDLEEQREKYQMMFKIKKLSDKEVISTLNMLSSYYTYELLDENE